METFTTFRVIQRSALITALALTLSGCAIKVEVSSDTTWRGYINGGEVYGEGSQTYQWVKQPGYEPCCYFEKLTADGYLGVKIVQRFQHDSERWTREPFGKVGVCVR